MKLRLIYGIGSAVLTVAAICGLPLGVAFLLMLLLTTLLMTEFYALFKAADPPFPIFDRFGTVCGLVLLTVVFLDALPNWPTLERADLGNWERFVIFTTIAVVMIRQFPQKRNTQPIMTMAGTLFGVFYVAYLLTFFLRLAVGFDAGATLRTPVGPAGRFLMLFLLFTVKFSDAGALFVGCRFGKHRLFSRISPKKTWEGLLGGVVTGMVAGMIVYGCMGEPGDVWGERIFGSLRLGLGDILILGLLLTVLGAVGDLAESLIKRAVEAKDSGRGLPGLGGLLDMFDSLLYTAPVLFFYVKAFGG